MKRWIRTASLACALYGTAMAAAVACLSFDADAFAVAAILPAASMCMGWTRRCGWAWRLKGVAASALALGGGAVALAALPLDGTIALYRALWAHAVAVPLTCEAGSEGLAGLSCFSPCDVCVLCSAALAGAFAGIALEAESLKGMLGMCFALCLLADAAQVAPRLARRFGGMGAAATCDADAGGASRPNIAAAGPACVQPPVGGGAGFLTVCYELSELYGLTERESEVLPYLARGYRAPFFARTLGMAPATARTHIQGIYRKMNISSQDGLICSVDEYRCGRSLRGSGPAAVWCGARASRRLARPGR